MALFQLTNIHISPGSGFVCQLQQRGESLFAMTPGSGYSSGTLYVCDDISRPKPRFEKRAVIDETGLRKMEFLGPEIYGMSNHNLAVSHDGGRSWTRTPSNPGTQLIHFKIWGERFVVSGHHGIHISPDKGASWEHIYPTNKRMFGLFIDAQQRLWCCGEEPGLLVCMEPDGAIGTRQVDSWAVLNRFCHTPQGHMMLCGDAGQLFRSTDQGASWETIPVPDGIGDIEDIAVAQNRILCGGKDPTSSRCVLLYSEDDGRSFRELDLQSSSSCFWSILPHSKGAYIGASYGVVYDLSFERPATSYTPREPKGLL